VEAARSKLCGALSASGQTEGLVERLRELVAAIEAGDRRRARTLASSLDEPSVSAAPHTISRLGLDNHEKKKGVSS
jgi:hypothetical protein